MNAPTCTVYEFSRADSIRRTDAEPGSFRVAAKKFPLHVLVVDDEPLIRWSIVESLADFGIDVEQAADAASALRMITTAALPFDVVVLDLRLPDMHDLSLLATLRQLLPGTRFILMTAFGTPDVLTEAALLGATVLNKPFELDTLADLVAGDRH
ncbi:MAG TPA: response regulator [Vicinamibacterales bacterium]|nr:response regulator [Vicinamibacterales bacterium]